MNIKKITLFLLLLSAPTLLLARPSLLSLQLQQAAINEKIAQLEMEDDAASAQLVVEKAVASTTATTTELSIDGVGINDIPTVTIGGMTATVNAATQTSTHIDASIPAVLQPGTYLVTVATGAQRGEFDAVDVSIATEAQKHVGAIYRWATWSTYNQSGGWYMQNNPAFFGGVNPSNWGDGNARAVQMSSDKEVLRTLFTRKGFAGKNAMVYANEWYSYSSTNSQHAAALFRIRNTTSSPIIWNVTSHHTAFGGWGERASIAVNGIEVWQSGNANMYAGNSSNQVVNNITIPPGQTSTVIFVSASTPVSTTRGTLLAFSSNSLELPVGLEYVDDLDTATGSWDQ